MIVTGPALRLTVDALFASQRLKMMGRMKSKKHHLLGLTLSSICSAVTCICQGLIPLLFASLRR